MSKNVTRLYHQFVPKHYKIDITLDKANCSFSGRVTLLGFKRRPSKRISLHQNGLLITKATITAHTKKGRIEHEVCRINCHASAEEVRLHTEDTLYPGEYELQLEFSGKTSNQMTGIYLSQFVHEGVPQNIIATQFESHHAREAFPCIDEPEAKAIFDLTITTDAGDTCLSNTPPTKKTEKDGKQTVTFETTPIMSSYLLAFVSGNLAYKQAKTDSGVTVRAYATPDNVEHTTFALDVAVKTLQFFNDYFEIEYPLEKCDLIALPDFASGAMENWGCITFRESCMLVDSKNTSLHSKQYVAMVVAHELAHQWFGNLVTMKWWTDLWLNEGFASWIEYLAVDHLFPEWLMWTQFTSDELEGALRLDALDTTHPIEVDVPHPDAIRTIFDSISYNKGASVIHMLQQYLGAEPFRRGLVHYLKTHAYGNAVTADLWQCLETITKKPVSTFMHAWTTQPGFPLVNITTQPNGYIVKQERFYLLAPSQLDKALWPVPLLSTPANVLPDSFERPEQLITTGHLLSHINSQRSGFYRTAYDDALHRKLVNQFQQNDPNLSTRDRQCLISDTFEIAKAGKGSIKKGLELLAATENESDVTVWQSIATAIGDIRRVMDDEKLRDDMKPTLQKITSPQRVRLGWEPRTGETHFDTLLRPIILGISAGADEPELTQKALETFDAAQEPEAIHPDLRAVIYDVAVRHGNEDTYQKLLNWYHQTTSADERINLASAITYFKQPKLINKTLDLFNSDTIRLQDLGYWLAYSLMSRHSKQMTWQWIKDQWQWLTKTMGDDPSYIRLPLYCARSFSSQEHLQDFVAFFEPKRSPLLERSINQGIETISWQKAWRGRDYNIVKEFFKQ